MGMDVATFARQLKADGIEAAKHEAEGILEEARKEAEKIKAAAKADAEKLEKDALDKIEKHKVRAADEMKLVSRDLTASFRKGIEEAGTRLLKLKVADSLNDKEIIKNAISELMKTQETGQAWEVALGAKIGKPLADVVVSLFKEKGAQATLTEELKRAGFEIRSADGNETFEVTEDSVTDSFRRLLSPELRKLLEQ